MDDTEITPGIAQICTVQDQYLDDMQDCRCFYIGDEYDRSLTKIPISIASSTTVCYDYSLNKYYWLLNASTIAITEQYQNYIPYMMYGGFKNWNIHFEIYVDATGTAQYGCLFSNYDTSAVPVSQISGTTYLSNNMVCSIENNQLVFGIYTNFDATTSSNNVIEFDLMTVDLPTLGLVNKWITVNIGFTSDSDQLKCSVTDGEINYQVFGARQNFMVKSYGGALHWGGTGGKTYANPYLNVKMSNFSINTTASKKYYSICPLWYPETIFLLSCDMIPMLDNGIAASVLTGVQPTLDSTNTLFGKPTYSFTGTQYVSATKLLIEANSRRPWQIGFWFKANQTSNKMVIFANGASNTDSSLSCYIEGNTIKLAKGGTNTGGAFSDTTSWHYVSIRTIHSSTVTIMYFSLDGNVLNVLGAGSSVAETSSGFLIGKNSSGNFFKGNLSNFKIDNISSSDNDAVPTKAFEPTDYF